MQQRLMEDDPRALPRFLVEKPWGQSAPPAPFGGLHDGRLGEIWFEPPPEMDGVLAKYLFTSERLSVQVHPSDEMAPAGACGKEECWYILNAEPGARVALGLTAQLSPEELRSVAADGSIEDYLAWHEVTAGDFMEIPPGTIHAIGSGLTIVEVQQNCDITYRLYDYGRPRELHLEDAVRCASTRPYNRSSIRNVAGGGNALLVDGRYYTAARLVEAPDAPLAQRFSAGCQIVVLRGAVTVTGKPIAVGLSTILPSLDAVSLADGAEIIAIAQK